MNKSLNKNLLIINSYIDLMKPSILIMVLITTILGFYLGSDGNIVWINLIWMLTGTTFSAGGASVLNQYLERDQDKIMNRTCDRPIPLGIISPYNALVFGIITVIIGTSILVVKINLLTGFLSLLTVFMYVLVYTPMKRVTWLNTSIGSVPGALPPIGGWAAATNSIDSGAWILFGILYLWQHPHFFAIAWMCKNDYEKAGFKMLPVIEPDGKRTVRQILWHLSLLFPISLLPVLIGMNGYIYLYGSLIITLYYFLSAFPMLKNKSHKNASQILKASVLYLPALLVIIIIDKGI
ncbi:MAG: heme o synthase [Candidatus Neomarinimicrobiota bacterium]|jgi:protoheme IX farnesyltransferase|nr:heme o synthase [Candidatus Neomarinimicrobiota bacterium]MEC9026419.1 heme o synthase [Candidatus Neomarinimicrobiota bacterium]MED5256695.1 heme o synthase [Candidatus Neomarinimicrobiota bacterium]MED5266004.1 heme o synthase [Candidatus Neomarinimicrobiota bacterium]|tara:strand:+ start:1817 stop:2698 length:882 start_codon:yes stop_codon:yes gene_type:complete